MDQLKRQLIVEKLRAGHTNYKIATALHMHRSTVKHVKDRLEERDLLGQGRKKMQRTEGNVTQVKAIIDEEPRQSIRKLAKDFEMPETSMRRLINDELCYKSRAIQTKNCSTLTQKDMRKKRCKVLLNWMKASKNSTKVRIFSDEKLLLIEPVLNRRNDRYISGERVEDVAVSIKFNPATKHCWKWTTPRSIARCCLQRWQEVPAEFHSPE